MCMMLYIGSDIPLATITFNKDSPALHTEKLGVNEAIVSKHFSTSYVLYIGSSEGCGCGFQQALIENNTNWMNIITEDIEYYQKNMQQLYKYVDDIIKKGGKVELYACWDGEFDHAPLLRQTISIKELARNDFYLKEQCFYTII